MSTPTNNPSEPRNRLLTFEFMGELILLAVVGAIFVYMLWDSRTWGTGAWLLPRIAIGFGIPFWIWRVISLFKTGMSEDGDQIMDTGFLDTDDPAAVINRRWLKLIGTTAGLLGGVWLLGFHVAIPAYTILYLVIFAGVKWYWTLIPALFFEGIMVFIYGHLLIAEWNEPVIPYLDWWRSLTGS